MPLAEMSPIAVPVVFVAGLASFLSPCVLPLVPGYLSYVGGAAGEETPRRSLLRVLPLTLAFVLGFTVIFMALGLSASLLGRFLFANRTLMSRIAGGIIILMGLAYLGVLPLPWLYSERRLRPRPGEGAVPAFVMGLAFGFGWTPCIGPTLGAALTLAASESTPGGGALLLFVYAMGLGIPFVLSALGVSRLMGALHWLRRHQKAIVRTGGAVLVGVGLLFVFNQVFWLSSVLRRGMTALHLDFWSSL
ncbi:MAG: cytochrome c biogenesis CcdA family protein [Actinomycetota bacterium]